MTTTTNANLLLDVFHANTFVEALRDTTIAARFGRRQMAPGNSGKVIRWQYFSNPSAVTTALSEGGDPTSPTDLSTTAVTATMAEYGAYFEPAKVMVSSAASGTLEEIIKASGWQAAISVDTLCYTQSLQDATNTNDAGTAMSIDDIRLCALELHGNNARPHPETTGGSRYAVLLSSEAYFDMIGEGAATWGAAKDEGIESAVDVNLNGQPSLRAGSAFGCQMYVSQNIQVASSEDLNYVLAKDAFGIVSLDSDVMDPRVIITTAEDRTDKPLRNAMTVGWWIYWVSELIDANRVVELKSDVS
jgi:hypothetical protein